MKLNNLISAVLAFIFLITFSAISQADSGVSSPGAGDFPSMMRSIMRQSQERVFISQLAEERKKWPADVPVVLYIRIQCSWDDISSKMQTDNFNITGSQIYDSEGELPFDSPYQGWLEGEVLMSDGLKGFFKHPPHHDKWIKGSRRKDYWRGGPGEPNLDFITPLWTTGLGQPLDKRRDVILKALPEHQYVKICDYGGIRIEAKFRVDNEEHTYTFDPDSFQWTYFGPKDGLNLSKEGLPSLGKPRESYKNFRALKEGQYYVSPKTGLGATVRVLPPTIKEIKIEPENPEITDGQSVQFRAWAEFEETCLEQREITELATWKPSGDNEYRAPDLETFEPEEITLKCISHPELVADICQTAEFESNIKFKPIEETIIAEYGKDKQGNPAKGETKVKINPSNSIKVNARNPSSLITWHTPDRKPSFQVEQFDPIKISVSHRNNVASDSLTLKVRPHENLFKIEETSIPTKIMVGEKIQLKAVELFCNGTVPDYRATENVKWKSSNNNVLKVAPNGQAIGISPGRAQIKLYNLSVANKLPITTRPIQVYSDKPSFIADSNQNYFLWVEKRGTWCCFEIGDKDELKQLKQDKIWHQIVDGPFNTLEMVETSYDRKASTAKRINILGYGALYYHMVGSDVCFIGRDHDDQMTDEDLARINPPLNTILNKENLDKKQSGWIVDINVIDKNGKGITGACIKQPGYGFGCEAKALGEGRYLLGPITSSLNQNYKKLTVLATAYHSGKGVNPMPHSQIKTVELGESRTASVVFQFDFSLDKKDEKKPSFIRASGKSKKSADDSGEQKPSFIRSSTTKTTSAVPKSSREPPSAIVKTQPKYLPSPKPQPKKEVQPQKSQKQKTQKAIKLSYEQCVQKFCPMCNFLFGQRPSLDDFPEDECGRCMKANEGNIRQCLKENQ